MAEQENPPIDVAEFARLVATVPEEELAAGFRTNREFILEQVFAQMPRFVNAEAARQADVVVEWRIRADVGEGYDQWQLALENGEARVERSGSADASVVLTLAAVDFIRLVTGNAHPTRLYLGGRLLIEGNLLTAALLQSYFAIPGKRGRRRS